MILIRTLSLTCLIYKSYVSAPIDRVMMSWDARLGRLDYSMRWAESLWTLLQPSESMGLGTLDTNPCQQPPSAWQVNNRSVILNLPCSLWSCRVLNFRNQVLYCQNSRVLSYRDRVLFRQVEWIGAPIRCSPRLPYECKLPSKCDILEAIVKVWHFINTQIWYNSACHFIQENTIVNKLCTTALPLLKWLLAIVNGSIFYRSKSLAPLPLSSRHLTNLIFHSFWGLRDGWFSQHDK
jgi:hypothetical protein